MTERPENSVYRRRWLAIHNHLNKHYEQPDVAVLRIALAQYAAHFCLSDPPVWSFILGPSSSGKTRIILNALGALPQTKQLDAITPNTFISGFGKKFGVLKQLPNQHGILLFSDFSTFLGLRQEARAEIQGQLRRVYDGELSKDVGNKKASEQSSWKGKVTIIAACTDALERHWSVERDLGERFLQVRMKTRSLSDMDMITTKSIEMIGKERQIAEEYEQLIKDFVDPETLQEAHIMKHWDKFGLHELTKLVAVARTSVIRDIYRNEIVDISTWEFPGRLVKEIIGIAKGNAMLSRRDVTSPSDVKLAMRIGLNTIPRRRYQMLNTLAEMPSGQMEQPRLRELLPDMTRDLFNRTRDELEAIDMIEVYENREPVVLKLRPYVLDLMLAINYKSRKKAE